MQCDLFLAGECQPKLGGRPVVVVLRSVCRGGTAGGGTAGGAGGGAGGVDGAKHTAQGFDWNVTNVVSVSGAGHVQSVDGNATNATNATLLTPLTPLTPLVVALGRDFRQGTVKGLHGPSCGGERRARKKSKKEEQERRAERQTKSRGVSRVSLPSTCQVPA